MPFTRGNASHTYNGMLFVGLFALSAKYLSESGMLGLGIFVSPLIIGIVLGALYGNTLGSRLPVEWVPGIHFTAKKILRLAIIFYGFRITFQEIAQVGVAGLTVATAMLVSTMLLGTFLGMRLLKIDRDTALLTASGSAVCGAAAVLATEGVLKSSAYKAGIAVATVVLFGTLALFIYPILYKSGILGMTDEQFGIYVGATVHEVAQVVAIGGALSPEVSNSAVIVKMTRVMLIAPLLLVLGVYLCSFAKVGGEACGKKNSIAIPWFAVGFVAVAAFNSLNLLNHELVDKINIIDTLLLTMSMTALGMTTNFEKIKAVGAKPFYLGIILMAWLMVGGYFITMFVTSVL